MRRGFSLLTTNRLIRSLVVEPVFGSVVAITFCTLRVRRNAKRGLIDRRLLCELGIIERIRLPRKRHERSSDRYSILAWQTGGHSTQEGIRSRFYTAH